MGRVGVSMRGAEARHTLILVDGQPVLGDFDKYSGAADEVQRLGTENVERIEVIQGAASAKYNLMLKACVARAMAMCFRSKTSSFVPILVKWAS